MALNVSDAVKTAFGSLKTGLGRKIAAIFFLIQVVNLVSAYFMGMQSAAFQGVGALLTAAAAVGSVAATIGGLRSFRENALEKKFFTDNIIWPFARTLGANVTTAVFSYLGAAVFMLPAFLVILSALPAGAIGAGFSISQLGLTELALSALGVALGAITFIYVTVTLLLAQPLIAIEDKRMFQALDESISRTRGSRKKIFLAGAVIFIAYMFAVMVSGAASVFNSGLGTVMLQLVAVPVFTPVFLALLNHFTEELPE